jgi:hypothetical protein
MFLEKEELAIEYAQQVGLLPITRTCCGVELEKTKRETSKAKGYFLDVTKKL